MSSVAKERGGSKVGASKERAEVPVSDEIHRAAERAGLKPRPVEDALDAEHAAENEQTKAAFEASCVPFVDYARSDEDHERRRYRQLEHRVLAEREGDSLRSRLMRIIGASASVDDPPEQGSSLTAERALLRYAAATTKAAGLALIGAEYVRANHNFESEFTDEDAAIVMCGLSELLEVGPQLLDSIEIADHTESRRAGGAS